MVVCAEADRVRFARSQAVLKRRTALGLPEMSFLLLRLNSCNVNGEVNIDANTPVELPIGNNYAALL